MRSIFCSIVAGFITAAVCAPAHATVWEFYETGFAFCGSNGGPCTPPPAPHGLLTLTIPDGDSSGSASWNPAGVFTRAAAPPPVVSGDPFSLSMLDAQSPGVASDNLLGPCDFCRTATINYNISWTETANQLTAISIVYNTVSDNIAIGLQNGDGPRGAAGLIASDDVIGGCVQTACGVYGVWNDPPVPDVRSDTPPAAAPEPASAILLVAALLLAACFAQLNSVRLRWWIDGKSGRSC